MCIYENLPKVFTEENGKPSGMFVEIMEYIAQKEGWKIEYVKGRWADCLERLESGEIDIMVNVPYTPLYSSICKFHRVPVFSSRLQIYARNGINISSILDLNEKPVGILARSGDDTELEHLIGGFDVRPAFVYFKDLKELVEALRKGHVQCAVLDHLQAVRYARRFGLEETSIIFSPRDLFFSAAKHVEPEILNAIDRNLLFMKKDHQSL
ncbi:MAG: transporter substrate-binding domain-containing protein [Archaeoglobaceae archaeon]